MSKPRPVLFSDPMIHAMSKPIEEKHWKWFGNAAHFCCGRWCRFHMATLVGPWLVSTVGEYVHPQRSGGNERTENTYLKEHPLGEEIDFVRLFETMVFKAGKPCESPECNCGLPSIDGSEVDCSGYNDRGSATLGHIELCRKWAAIKKKPTP